MLSAITMLDTVQTAAAVVRCIPSMAFPDRIHPSMVTLVMEEVENALTTIPFPPPASQAHPSNTMFLTTPLDVGTMLIPAVVLVKAVHPSTTTPWTVWPVPGVM